MKRQLYKFDVAVEQFDGAETPWRLCTRKEETVLLFRSPDEFLLGCGVLQHQTGQDERSGESGSTCKMCCIFVRETESRFCFLSSAGHGSGCYQEQR